MAYYLMFPRQKGRRRGKKGQGVKSFRTALFGMSADSKRLSRHHRRGSGKAGPKKGNDLFWDCGHTKEQYIL